MDTENLVNSEQLVIVGIDWADTSHVFHLIDPDETPLTGDVKQDPKAIDDLVKAWRKRSPGARTA